MQDLFYLCFGNFLIKKDFNLHNVAYAYTHVYAQVKNRLLVLRDATFSHSSCYQYQSGQVPDWRRQQHSRYLVTS